MRILQSTEDDSVNFVFSGEYPGYLEARYVRRMPKYFACYLSSQSGCDQGCRMCHLTATKQTKHADTTIPQYVEQARAVFNWYDEKCPKASVVHFNFMARGEAFNNKQFLEQGSTLLANLAGESVLRNLFPRFLISTIMPECIAKLSLSQTFPIINPEIYYSIYSVNPDFRKKWLPKAMPVDAALESLKEYQSNTKKIVKLHWAFIEDENDSADDVKALAQKVNDSGLRVDVSIVRYNSYGPKYGQESSIEVIGRNVDILKTMMPSSKFKIITRVGPDVKASCGMFVEPNSVKA